MYDYLIVGSRTSKKEANVIFSSRLAEYKYYDMDMDKVIESVLKLMKLELR